MKQLIVARVVALLLALSQGGQAERILMLSPVGTRSHLSGFMPMVFYLHFYSAFSYFFRKIN